MWRTLRATFEYAHQVFRVVSRVRVIPYRRCPESAPLFLVPASPRNGARIRPRAGVPRFQAAGALVRATVQALKQASQGIFNFPELLSRVSGGATMRCAQLTF